MNAAFVRNSDRDEGTVCYPAGLAVGRRHLAAKMPAALPIWRKPIPVAETQDRTDFGDADLGGRLTQGPIHYFNLLSDRDLEELRPFLEIVSQRRSEIIRHWYGQHAIHFGDSRSCSRAKITRILEDTLKRAFFELLGGEFRRYVAEIRQLGELLAAQGTPFDEVIASLQFFKNSIYSVVLRERTVPKTLAIAFDKLSHVLIILLISRYFASDSVSVEERSVALEGEVLLVPAADTARFHGMIGASVGMQQLYLRVQAAGATRGNLLVVGESGTGKELVARAVHKCSANPDAPFVALNCAALPKDLTESELFGYRRGAFSGATTDYPGLFRAADGGTLFLDEISEMSADVQTKLLRAIQERAIRPLGATREQPVDVRLIASTNRDPQAALSDGCLRADLYYRLQGVLLAVPPLRDRREDIPLLVEHFIGRFKPTFGREVAGIERRALDALLKHDWPGNVRELCNAIEGAFTFGRGRLITLEDLPPALRASADIQSISTVSAAHFDAATSPLGTFAEAERALIAQALQKNNGNKVHAANQLRISRKKLYAKIAKYGLGAVQRSRTTQRFCDGHSG